MKKKFPLVITFLAILFAFDFPTEAVGQISEINEGQYIRAINGAFDREAKINRRVILTETIFVDGKKTVQFERTTLYVVPDRRHTVLRTIRGEKEETEETIAIGSDRFVRKNGGKWEVETGLSLTGISIPNNAKTQCTYERRLIDGTSVNVFRKRSDYVSEGGEDKGSRMYYDSVVHLNDSGLRVRSELNRGYVDSKKWQAKEIVTYDYNPENPGIVAPIK